MGKKLAVFVLFCSISAFLCSCQAKEPDSEIHIDEEPVETDTLSMFVPVGVDLGGVDSFRDLTLIYNEMHSNEQISVDSAAAADGFDRFLEERLDVKGAVDVFVVNAENVKNIARKNQFYDLSGLDSFQKLTESAREQATVDGVAYAIPLKMAVYVLEANVSILKRNGLEVPENYDEFMHCCQVLKAQGITPIAINRWWALAVPVMARSLYPVYQAEDKEELIEGLNSGEIKIGDYMLPGFRMFEEFLEQGYYGDNLVMEEVDAIRANTQEREDFYYGRTAFRFCPIENLEETEMKNGDKSVFVGIPMLPDGVISLPSISVRLSANANSSHMEEALDFVEYLASERVKLLAQDKSSLSPFHSNTAQKADASWQEDILQLLEAGHQIPLEDMNLHFGCWDNTRRLCLEMVGGMTAEEAAEEYNRIQMEEILQYKKTKQP